MPLLRFSKPGSKADGLRLLLALLVRNRAGSLAGGLAGSLAFAAAVALRFEAGGLDGFDVLHDIALFQVQ